MDNDIDNQYIGNAIAELIDAIGIREGIDSEALETLLRLLRAGKTKECTKGIASQLGLPIEINLSFVSKNYSSDDNNRFQTCELSRTDRNGRGIGGIVAQVSIPNCLPGYGTSRLTGFPVNVKVSENCNEQSLTFMAVVAHELSP